MSIVLLKCFTNILGAPVYIYDTSASYRTGKDFYKTDEVAELELWYPPERTLNQLKYCSELKSLFILISQTENLDFISDKELTSFSFKGKFTDWSKISTLTHLIFLDVYQSDFNDVSLLRTMSELETLHINSFEAVNLSGIGELPKLNKLSIYAQNDDISEISQCTGLTSLIIYSCPNIKDISFLKDMDNIEELYLQCLDIEDYSFLTEMKSLKTVKIWDITLGDETIKELQDKGVDVVDVKNEE